MKTSYIISKVAEQYLQEKLGSKPKLPSSIIEKFKTTDAFKEMSKAELIMSKTIQLKYKREFGVRNFAFFRFLVQLRQFSLGGPIQIGMYNRLLLQTKRLLKSKGSDGQPLNSILRGKVLLTIKNMKKFLTRLENQIKGMESQALDVAEGFYLYDSDTVNQLLRSNIAWKKIIISYTDLVEEIGRDKGIHITKVKKASAGTMWFSKFRKAKASEVEFRRLEDSDPETFSLITEQRKSLKEIDNEIDNSIEMAGLVKESVMIKGRPITIGIDPDTREMTAFDRGMGALPVTKRVEIVNGKEKTIWEGEYVDMLDERDEQREKLYHIPSASSLLTESNLNSLRKFSDDQLNMAVGEVVLSALTDNKAKADKLARLFPTQMIEVEGEMKKVIVGGRFKGFLFDDMVNANGRLVEGTGWAYDQKKRKPIRRNVGDTEPYITKIEIEDKYGNKKTRLQINVPSGRDKESKRIRERLYRLSGNTAGKAGSISSLQYEDKTRRRTYTFDLKDYALIQNLVGGSLALSTEALRSVENYYEDLALAEEATADENLEFYSQKALGGFKKDMPPLLKVQKQALAWLDANGDKGVIALDTGVGKTVTSVAVMQKMVRDGKTDEGYSYTNSKGEEISTNGRFLWVCPKGLEGNLPKEIRNWLATEGEKEKGGGSLENSKLAMVRRMVANTMGDKAPADDLLDRVDVMTYRQWGTANKKKTYESSALKKKGVRFSASEFIAIFFDEAHKKLTGSSRAAYYAASMEHPHKILLSASPMEHSPKDSYILSSISNNKPTQYPAGASKKVKAVVRKNREEMRAFTSRYCEQVGQLIVGVKDDPLIKRELNVWTKRNLFYADKEEIEYGKDKNGEQIILQKLKKETVTVSFDDRVSEVYRAVTSSMQKVLDGMVIMARDRGDFEYEYKQLKDDQGELIFETEKNEDGSDKLDEENNPIYKLKNGEKIPVYETEVDEFGNTVPVKKQYGGEAVMKYNKDLTPAVREKIEKIIGGRKFAPLMKILNGLSNYPKEALLELAHMMEKGKYLDGKKVPEVLTKGSRRGGIGLFFNLEKAGITPQTLRELAETVGNPKMEYCIDRVADIMDNDSPEIPSSRALLFSDDEKMVVMSALELSKQIPGKHIAALKDEMRVFENGREIVSSGESKTKDCKNHLCISIPEYVIDACFTPRGFPVGYNPTEEEILEKRERAIQSRRSFMSNAQGMAMHKVPFRQRKLRPYPNLPYQKDTRSWVKKYNPPLRTNKEWREFVFKKIVSPNLEFKTISLHGQTYSTGQNLQAFNTVIHLDRDHWSNEEMKQRTARSYRQGQKDQVREITVDTVMRYEGPVQEGSDDTNTGIKSLDEIRKFFQNMENDIFNAVIKGAQDQVLGEEFKDVTITGAGYKQKSKDVGALILSGSPFASKPPSDMD